MCAYEHFSGCFVVICGAGLFPDEGHRWFCQVGCSGSWGSSTLASLVRLVISRLVLVFALPLHFHGRLRVLRSMFIPGALHGVEASFLAGTCLRKLRAAFLGVACLVGSLCQYWCCS